MMNIFRALLNYINFNSLDETGHFILTTPYRAGNNLYYVAGHVFSHLYFGRTYYQFAQTCIK